MTFSVTILGSNSALPTSTRYPSAQILNVSERFFLIDCGEGTQMQLRKYRIKFARINHIFISHLHGDHCFGLIGLISTLGLLGRKVDLHIYAHKDLEELLGPHLEYFCADLPYEIIFHHLDFKNQKVIYEDKRVVVESFPLIHRVPTCGFLFREKEKEPNIRKDAIIRYNLSIRDIVSIKQGNDFVEEGGNKIPVEQLTVASPRARSYAYCSDTRYCRRILPIINEVDLLYHEATFTHELKKLATQTSHTTARQAATLARDANVGKLLLGHFSNRYKKLDDFIVESSDVFNNTVLVKDGDTFHVANQESK
ncbi:ribonuclease Z [Marinilabiliaceae bacterium JC017]|nr:ribonuclease Z [Marinilabiliaceae bacterium JC017]